MNNNETKVARCESIIRYEFSNKTLCLEALQTSGHMLVWQNAFVQIKTNDKLAVLGDVKAKAHLCEKWYETGRSKGKRLVCMSGPMLTTKRAVDANRAGRIVKLELKRSRSCKGSRSVRDPEHGHCERLCQNYGHYG